MCLRSADSDEAGHAFQYEAGHLFRSEAGQRSDLKPATFGLPPQVSIDDVSLVLIGQGRLDLAAIIRRVLPPRIMCPTEVQRHLSLHPMVERSFRSRLLSSPQPPAAVA